MEKPESFSELLHIALAKKLGPKWYPDLPYGQACERAYQEMIEWLGSEPSQREE